MGIRRHIPSRRPSRRGQALPPRQRRLRLVVSRGAPGKVTISGVVGILRESLVLEQGAIALAQECLPHAAEPELRRRLSSILERIRRDSKTLSKVLRDLGGNPDAPPGPYSVLQQQRLDALLQLEIPPGKSLITSLENLIIVTSQACLHGDLLGEATRLLEAPQARALAYRFLEEFEEDKLELLSELRQILTQARIQAIVEAGSLPRD